MSIIIAKLQDAENIANIISVANKDVALKFGINKKNNSKHPSFCTEKWIESDFEKGQKYFLYLENEKAIGCVAFEKASKNKAYLNRLSVLPKHRNKGIGELLIKYIIYYAKSKKIAQISIGVIDKHKSLLAWYMKLGFIEYDKKEFSHLPFKVLFMKYLISFEK